MKKMILSILPQPDLRAFVSSWFKRKQSEPQIYADVRRSLFRSCARLRGRGVILALVAFGVLGLHAQEEEVASPGPGTDIIAPEEYTFQMQLKPGVDVAIDVSPVEKKEKGVKKPDESTPIRKIERKIRAAILKVSEDVDGEKTERFYTGSWCGFEDPRKGVSVVRPHIEGVVFPMRDYFFPELLWAEPKTRQAIPVQKPGEPQIFLFKDGSQVLEVDAITGRPLRYEDGESEWVYSYKESSSNIDVPEKLKEAFRRVLPKSQQ